MDDKNTPYVKFHLARKSVIVATHPHGRDKPSVDPTVRLDLTNYAALYLAIASYEDAGWTVEIELA